MISRNFIDQLHCPYCETRFDLERADEENGYIRNGILCCACYRYPIIDSIAVLRQRSGAADARDPGVAYLEAGDTAGALQHAISSSPMAKTRTRRQRITDLLKHGLNGNRASDATGRFFDALNFYRPSGYADYLYHRYANNSFLAGIPLFALLKEFNGAPANVLDLNCGVGHASFLMQALFPNLSVIATDHDFTNLHLASRYLVPAHTTCLCLDAELPLPFDDKFLDAALCMDGLHYIRSKRALMREMDRIVKSDGIWLFPHMHNAAVTNVCAGVPLSAEDYLRCFECLPSRIYDEAAIFDTFMRDQILDLEVSLSGGGVRKETAFSLVATRRADVWRKHDVAPVFLKTQTRLTVNPIYEVRENGNGVQLRMTWPNPGLESECQSVKPFLPEKCSISDSVWTHLQSGTLTAAEDSSVQELIKSCVLVRLPDTYA
jgi:SAM-dependent methyltransferase/uncharacterized protein YbaR (Trm112 family)